MSKYLQSLLWVCVAKLCDSIDRPQPRQTMTAI